MSRRMVLVVNQATGSPARIRLAEELVDSGGAEDEVQIDFTGLAEPLSSFVASPPVPGAVGSFGKSLFDWLALHQLLAPQLAAARQNGCLLTVDDRIPPAQSLPWEAMQDGQGNFVALRSSPLFSRIYVPRRSPKEVQRTFRPPLRVLAVIAAAGAQGDGSVLSGLPELEALLAGLAGKEAPGFVLRVLGADDDVRARIEALADPRVTFRELSGYAALEAELAEQKPDILHFFCHGFMGDEATPPHLELATRTDQLAKKERGSILLAGDDLVPLLEEQPQIWMVVLNSCLGAAATESASLARELIGGADLPAVIAMREAIERRDAHLFAEELMREVQKVVAEIVATPPPHDLEWARLLPAVRARLVRERGGSLAKAKDLREWTLPVLYVHRDDFRINQVLPATLSTEAEKETARLEGQIQKLESMRGDLAAIPDLPQGVIENLDAKVAELRAQLAKVHGAAAEPQQQAVAPAPLPNPQPAPPAAEGERLKFAVNAWTGGPAEATAVSADWTGWALRQQAGRPQSAKLAIPESDLAARFDWRNPKVGWGVVLPLRPGGDPAALDDAPEPIRRLIEERRKVLGRVPVFRYQKESSLAHSLVLLQDFAAESSLTVDASPTGVAEGSIPQYLLLCGSPAEIPWDLQYVLSTVRFVGRLDLDEAGLARYVEHLLSGWEGSGARRDRSLTWTVYHSKRDITSTLREQLTQPFHERLAAPQRLGGGALWLDGKVDAATREQLAARLAEHRPGLIVTSSHGATWPLDDPAKMGRDLGLLVDQNENLLDPATLLAGWQPDGAVWLAHACCSAGAKARSDYEGLFDASDKTGKLLAAVARVGDVTAPLPRALLGAEKPLRAFVGQVEPTFDWTVRHPETEQSLTEKLIAPLQDRFLGGRPAGSLLEAWHQRAAVLNQAWFQMKQKLDAGGEVAPSILYPRLAAADVASTVLLGDPTAVVG